uniref:Uncharacterized protein n=1 Tax=Aegilops tauschii subsp. strangulata TaxID=200361 RepID=A0A453T667_AEGTS
HKEIGLCEASVCCCYNYKSSSDVSEVFLQPYVCLQIKCVHAAAYTCTVNKVCVSFSLSCLDLGMLDWIGVFPFHQAASILLCLIVLMCCAATSTSSAGFPQLGAMFTTLIVCVGLLSVCNKRVCVHRCTSTQCGVRLMNLKFSLV